MNRQDALDAPAASRRVDAKDAKEDGDSGWEHPTFVFLQNGCRLERFYPPLPFLGFERGYSFF
ncbi:MAG: hypothetical protein KME26_10305 [Oscillatoria princeps RMCB-10]|nr:hypothetical protein [Oscillatoria princeps RMCB-10]